MLPRQTVRSSREMKGFRIVFGSEMSYSLTMKKTLGAILVPFLGASAGIVGCLMTLPFLMAIVAPLVGTLVGVVWLFYLGAWKTAFLVLALIYIGRLILDTFYAIGGTLFEIRQKILEKAEAGKVELILSGGLRILGPAAVAVPCASWALGVFWLFNWLAALNDADTKTAYLLASLGVATLPWVDSKNLWPRGSNFNFGGVALGYTTAVGLALRGMDHRISEWTIIGFMILAFLVMAFEQASDQEAMQ
jgi:hypothetical protein